MKKLISGFWALINKNRKKSALWGVFLGILVWGRDYYLTNKADDFRGVTEERKITKESSLLAAKASVAAKDNTGFFTQAAATFVGALAFALFLAVVNVCFENNKNKKLKKKLPVDL